MFQNIAHLLKQQQNWPLLSCMSRRDGVKRSCKFRREGGEWREKGGRCIGYRFLYRKGPTRISNTNHYFERVVFDHFHIHIYIYILRIFLFKSNKYIFHYLITIDNRFGLLIHISIVQISNKFLQNSTKPLQCYKTFNY